jgi:ABC-type branched-subunit amino acid transport system substrate-binding protein
VPGLYQKLLDIDKVDVVIGGFGTNMLAPAMAVLIQKEKMLIGLFGVAINAEFHYPKYFSMIPLGPEPKAAMSKGFFETAVTQNPKPETVAIVAADAEFPINAAEGARENTKGTRLQDHLPQTLSAGDYRLRANRAGDSVGQSGHRRHLLLSAGLGPLPARCQRDRL